MTSPTTTGTPTEAGSATEQIPTSSTSAGSMSAGETMSPTTGTLTTGTASDTATTSADTTMGVDPSTSTGVNDTTSDSAGTTAAMMPDMGNPGCLPDQTPSTFDYIWIANTSQGTVSKIDTQNSANCGVYARIQEVA